MSEEKKPWEQWSEEDQHYGYSYDLATIEYDGWKDLFVNGVYQGHSDDAVIEIGPTEPNNIIFNAGPESEMLKITQNGFYVRGVKVPQDDKEAAAVYKAFREWMTWNIISRES